MHKKYSREINMYIHTLMCVCMCVYIREREREREREKERETILNGMRAS